MYNSLNKLLQGYNKFRAKYITSDENIMNHLHHHGQTPHSMVVSCCDSRVDPALILQCDPGDLFVVRNVANIVPPYEKDNAYHGTSAALEFGICYLKVKHLILLGHSGCGGINALLNNDVLSNQNDFIEKWVSIVKNDNHINNIDEYSKQALTLSYKNCLTFPWIQSKVQNSELFIHLWFFDIKHGNILVYDYNNKVYNQLHQNTVEIS